MPTTASKESQLTRDQRGVLTNLLQSRMVEYERESATHLDGLTQADAARQTLLQDADDAGQRAGAHEVEGIVSDIDSAQYTQIRSALQRIHSADYGTCIDCHAAIPFERLRLVPHTLKCFDCQKLDDEPPYATLE